MKFLSFLCTKWMENCEAMTSAPHSFAYSYRLVKKCFLKICETSKCHNFLIFQPIFIRFSLLCLKIFTLSSEIKLNLLWSSSLNSHVWSTLLLLFFSLPSLTADKSRPYLITEIDDRTNYVNASFLPVSCNSRYIHVRGLSHYTN